MLSLETFKSLIIIPWLKCAGGYILSVAADLITRFLTGNNSGHILTNHHPHGCLLNRLLRRRSKKTSKLCVTGLCEGNSPHNRPVTRKNFPFDDVIMPYREWSVQLSILTYVKTCTLHVCSWKHVRYHSKYTYGNSNWRSYVYPSTGGVNVVSE